MKPRFSGPPVVPFLSWVPLVLATPLACPSFLQTIKLHRKQQHQKIFNLLCELMVWGLLV